MRPVRQAKSFEYKQIVRYLRVRHACGGPNSGLYKRIADSGDGPEPKRAAFAHARSRRNRIRGAA